MHIKRCDRIWPEPGASLGPSGISEYAVFTDHETNALFSVGNQGEGASPRDPGHRSPIKKWQAYGTGIMKTNADRSPKTTEKVFYLE